MYIGLGTFPSTLKVFAQISFLGLHLIQFQALSGSI